MTRKNLSLFDIEGMNVEVFTSTVPVDERDNIADNYIEINKLEDLLIEV